MKMIVKAFLHPEALACLEEAYPGLSKLGGSNLICESGWIIKTHWSSPQLLKTFVILRVWNSWNRIFPGIRLIAGVRSLLRSDVFLIFDFQEEWKAQRSCAINKNLILETLWYSEKAFRVEVERSWGLSRALEISSYDDVMSRSRSRFHEYQRGPRQARLVLNADTCAGWFVEAGDQAIRFIREQKKILQRYTDATLFQPEPCLPMWERTMLGGLLKRFELS